MFSHDLCSNSMLNLSNFYLKIKGLFYVVNPTPMGVGDLKSENPGVPGGGGFTILKTPGTPWVGFPKPYLNSLWDLL